MSAANRTYEERAQQHPNACAKGLLETVVHKNSNLCVSVDVTTKEEFLAVVEAVGLGQAGGTLDVEVLLQ